MVKFNPDNKEKLTIGEIFEGAMKATEKEEAKQYLNDYTAHIQKYLDETPDPNGLTAMEIAKQNLGYYSGYYNKEIYERIMELFETEHPVFGKSWPTNEEAYVMGKHWRSHKHNNLQMKREMCR
jgi:hypothetical protein